MAQSFRAIAIPPDAFPKVQDASTKPEQWNTEWENLFLSKSFLVDPQINFRLTVIQQQARSVKVGVEGPISADDMYSFVILHESTCEIQHRIGIKTINAFSKKDFEKRWLDVGVDVRRKHALRALANGCSLARNLNQARAYSFDILRVDHLSQNGKVLIDLLKAITPDDISVVLKDPYYFPEKTWDALKAEQERGNNELEKYALREILILRTKLIYLVVEGMMDSFLDEALPTVVVQKNRDQRSASEKQEAVRANVNMMKLVYGEREGKARARAEFEAYKDRKSRRGILCTNCEVPESDGQKFQRCKKCWDLVGRDIPYCSKDCQVKDWRIRHKEICGKHVSTIDEALKSSAPRTAIPAPSSSQIGPPVSGYKRSPFLVGHIRELDMNPKVDFVLRIGPNEFVNIDTPYPPIQKLFRAARDKAMTTGDKVTVAELCHYIIWFCRAKWYDKEKGFNFDATIEQMEKEFEFPELRKAMLEMQDRQWADAQYRRPPLVYSLSPKEWIAYLRMDKIDMERRL
ncbi:hypothetical protein K435DRAFT_836239 [Dendrothele bispora CBS 962.96]|uniref:MYND-type domain-containing protein n=1 Tax=Dendrothele bispora (strain CBS 962.96) TaxID=1314807 RepID=A0A4S8MIZ1_DENBC|nr:hypothetical protein K435DRAFT_836239 [Dendrothele bispora CBS 962.96]